MSRLIAVALGLCTVIGAAAAADLPMPTDADLRSAYCIPILETEIGQLNKTIAEYDETLQHVPDAPADQRTKMVDFMKQLRQRIQARVLARQSALSRLKRYYLRRAAHLNATALAAASQQGTSDLQLNMARASSCRANCAQGVNGSGPTDYYGCTKDCVGTDIVARMDACLEPKWLP